MSAESNDDANTPESEDEVLTRLLERSLQSTPAPGPSLLPGIQKRIRQQTRGRFYRDRWSEGKRPIPLLLMAALLILMIIMAIFIVWQPLTVESEPSPLLSPTKDPFFAPSRP